MLKINTEDITTVKTSPDYFTGTAWLTALVNNEGYVVSSVTFEPGARNHWHTHPQGQVLIAMTGKGLMQQEGMPVQILLPGDAVYIPAGEVHWHGAAADSIFTHLAIQTPDKNGQVVNWLKPVTDAEYNR